MRLARRKSALERGGRRLFSGLSFAVEAGEALIVVGPNGAGKSSLLRALAGLLPFAAGRVRLRRRRARRVGEQTHYLGHADSLKGALTAGENLAFWAGVLGGDRAAAVGCRRWRGSACPCRRFPGARAVGGPEAARRAGAAAGRAAAAVAARRADDRARRGRAGAVRRSDARASGGRRADRRGDPCAARAGRAGARARAGAGAAGVIFWSPSSRAERREAESGRRLRLGEVAERSLA